MPSFLDLKGMWVALVSSYLQLILKAATVQGLLSIFKIAFVEHFYLNVYFVQWLLALLDELLHGFNGVDSEWRPSMNPKSSALILMQALFILLFPKE